MYVYKSTVESGVANAAFRAILLAAQSHAVPAEGKAPVSAVYPFSPVKANVSRLCEKLKSAPIWRLCRNKGLHPLRRFAAIGYSCICKEKEIIYCATGINEGSIRSRKRQISPFDKRPSGVSAARKAR